MNLDDEKQIAAFLHHVGTGDLDAVRAALAARPELVDATGPHPFWGGRPQPLHVAIECNRREVFDLLLAAGADVNGCNDGYLRWSPLLLTLHWNQAGMREELLRRGARVGLPEALAMADDARVEQILADDPRAVATPAPNDGSLLCFARTPRAIDLLLERGVSIDLKDRWNTAPIEAFCRMGARGQELVRYLIARGAKAAPQEYARLGDHATLERLHAEDPAAVLTPAVLAGAVDFGHHDLVRWLIAKGADVDARRGDKSNQTSLHSAAWNGDLEMVKLLVEASADWSLLDDEYHAEPAGWAETAVEVTNNPKCAEVAAYLRGLEG